MTTLSIRLPDEIDRLLEQEAQRSHVNRSTLARDAIVAYLKEIERKRFMQEMVAEMRSVFDDPVLREDARTIAEAFDGGEEAEPETVEEKWWR